MFNEPLVSFNAAYKLRIPISGAYSWLISQMTVAEKTGIDIKSYDEFMANVVGYRVNNSDLGMLDDGYLELMHPARPEQRRLLDFFCDPAREPERVRILGLATPARFKFLGMRLTQHCHRVGNTADARVVIDAAEGVLRRQSQSSDIASKQQGIKRKATKKELELGVKVDSDRYVAALPWVHKLEETGKNAVQRFTGSAAEGNDGSEAVLVKTHHVSSIIGRAGENIRRIESESGARLRFSETKDSRKAVLYHLRPSQDKNGCQSRHLCHY